MHDFLTELIDDAGNVLLEENDGGGAIKAPLNTVLEWINNGVENKYTRDWKEQGLID